MCLQKPPFQAVNRGFGRFSSLSNIYGSGPLQTGFIRKTYFQDKQKKRKLEMPRLAP